MVISHLYQVLQLNDDYDKIQAKSLIFLIFYKEVKMSYREAKELFADNDKNHVKPDDQPFYYNLNRGLHRLVDALEADARKTQQRLAEITNILRSLEK